MCASIVNAGLYLVFLFVCFAVFATGVNLATGCTTRQSSVRSDLNASLAIDGNRDGAWAVHTCTFTDFGGHPWWGIDLGSIQTVKTVHIYNRADGKLTIDSRSLIYNIYIYLSHIYNKSCPIHATEHMCDTNFLRADKLYLLHGFHLRISHLLDFYGNTNTFTGRYTKNN